jgi:hypothetical protein
MSGHKYIEIGAIILLGWIVIFLTLPFERHNDENLRKYSHEPFFRILLGIILLIVSAYSVPVELLMFLVIFFWIADIHLVSNMKFDCKKHAQ